VVLHHVAQRTRLLVITRALADAQRFGDGDAHALDVLPVPQRFEHRVGEPEHEKVLHGFLAEVVVDPEDLRLVEIAVRECVQRHGRRQVAPEGFLDDEPRPAGTVGEAGATERFDRRAERRRGQREVERAVARQVVLALDPFDARLQRLVIVVAVLPQRLVEHAVGAPVRRFRLHRLHDGLREGAVGRVVQLGGARRAEHQERLADDAARHQARQRREQLAARQVTAGPKNHEQRRLDGVERHRRGALSTWSMADAMARSPLSASVPSLTRSTRRPRCTSAR
jgi:hypothetical protein